MATSRWLRLATVLPALAGLSLTACTTTEVSKTAASEPSSQPRHTLAAPPEECIDAAGATRASVDGTPVWARFCPGPEGRTAPAEVPSDALTSHLELVSDLVDLDDDSGPARKQCGFWGRTYRVQIGYSDGRVASIEGHTDPACVGRLATGGLVRGPESLGVYGAFMTAFGRQYADGFDHTSTSTPLQCPLDPRKPDSVDVDGPSASLDTGFHLGHRDPMVMPLTAVRGIVCTWQYEARGEPPDIRDLTPEQAERVRIGMHAIAGGTVDCGESPRPTYTAVVEDQTGTRRAVTVVDSFCSTVTRSDGGGGLGFAWLDR